MVSDSAVADSVDTKKVAMVADFFALSEVSRRPDCRRGCPGGTVAASVFSPDHRRLQGRVTGSCQAR